MMESGLKDDTERPDMIAVGDLRRNLSSDFSECSDFQDPSDLEKEHLKVYLRIRPFSSAEIENGESQDCVAIHPPETVLLKAPQSSLSARLSDKSVPVTAQRFQFSQVYGPDTTQKEMFDGTVKGLVRDVLEGQNSLVFTYGITNAGKTYTFLGPDTDPGILPRSLNMIFSSLDGRIFTQMCLKPQRCRDFIRLTKDQQNEEAVAKRNLLKLFKETDAQKSTSCHSSKSDLEDGSTLSDTSSAANERSLAVDLDIHTKFSIWVSFCEIYNENIHDLLEQHSNNALRRTNLRLCQDVKGNSFIKDLRWVQVSSADEALKVMKLGKRNQSISSTKLNLLSSRSHSIFSVRTLKVVDVGVGIPRVESVSELALCDLAGSERCAKTLNIGERLKEAGNINTSLLSLGKCINALRNNQQARQHVPFRESKLTHYLQGYFTGRSKACMIVNINQCASMYDETLNVLKFSAVAQKVVVLNTKSVPVVVKRSAREVSFIINNVDRREMRRSSLVRWDPSLEDVHEDSDTDEDEKGSEMEDTILDPEEEGKETLQFIEEIQQQLRKEKGEHLALEARVRDEVTKEFSELISQMQEDYSERISRDRELIEERCERRLEILKNLVGKTAVEDDSMNSAAPKSEVQIYSILDAMSSNLAGIRPDAQAAQSCLVSSDPKVSVTLLDLEKKVTELSDLLSETQNQLSLKTQGEKRLQISRPTTNLPLHRNVLCIPSPFDVKGVLLCPLEDSKVQDNVPDNGCQDSALLEVKGQLECCLAESKQKDKQITDLEQECHTLKVCIQDLKSKLEERVSPEHILQEKVQQTSLETKSVVTAVDCSNLKVEVVSNYSNTTEHLKGFSQELAAAKSQMAKQDYELGEKNKHILTLEQEITRLQLEAETSRYTLADYDELKKVNSDLQAEVTTLREIKAELEEKVRCLENEKEERNTAHLSKEEGLEDREVGLTNPNTLGSKNRETHSKINITMSEKEAELAQREDAVASKEAQLLVLQKKLKEAQERLEEEETQAVQEVRRREAERRRELVAVAEEAIAQKDAELQKRQEEINRSVIPLIMIITLIIMIFISQSSSGSCPLVLDSSEISTETGRRSRFPRPELEISFSPLQPDRFALKRQGEDSAVTVKMSRPTRKRKSGEMEKDGVESENIRNTKSRMTPHLTGEHCSHSSQPSNAQESNQKGKKDKTIQKIGDFLHGSPTFLGSKAKRIMGLMSRKSPDGGAMSLKLKSKRDKQKHDRPDISSPMDIPAHQIIGRNPEEKESENLIKKRLRTRIVK
uniref:Kinesin family member 20Ba n=1 Tax=Cyprinus carpio TaxID=7962 RepID=A0A8C1ZGY9_CYPCA